MGTANESPRHQNHSLDEEWEIETIQSCVTMQVAANMRTEGRGHPLSGSEELVEAVWGLEYKLFWCDSAAGENAWTLWLQKA
jgi:hypothetical protein